MSTVIVERTYDAPIARVWEALTTKEQMKQWYFDVSDFKPEPGFQFEFTGGDQNVKYRHLCEVIEADAPNKLSYTWRYDNIGGISLVSIELFAEADDTTRVKLTHSGLDFKTDDKNFKPASFNEGWNHILDIGLRNYVEKSSRIKTILIHADLEQVWETIVNPNHGWANAFGGGALAETDWQQGSKIIWTDLDGNVGANGIVGLVENETLLELRYYDDVDPESDSQLGDYREIFRLKPDGDKVLLEVETGKLQKYYLNKQDKMWDDALEAIKKTAESK